MTTSVQRVYNLNSSKRKIYSKQIYDMAHLIQHSMTQVSMKRGLKKWGEIEKDLVLKELKQFHMREAFLPLYPYQITQE